MRLSALTEDLNENRRIRKIQRICYDFFNKMFPKKLNENNPPIGKDALMKISECVENVN
jgi:hypothetical protein